MDQQPVPSIRAGEPEPMESPQKIPVNLAKEIRDKSAAWLKQQDEDIDANPENPALKPGYYTPAQWATVSKSSKAYRESQAKAQVKELLGKWPKENLNKMRATRERAKKEELKKDMYARSDKERNEKKVVTETERAAKALEKQQTDEVTAKERANKPSQAEQDKLDEEDTKKKHEERVKEAEEKYKVSDAEQKAAEEKELAREKEVFKERAAKQKKLEDDAKAGGVTLGQAMEDRRHDLLDILAKDAYIASMQDSNGHQKASAAEKNVAVALEERAQRPSKPEMVLQSSTAPGEAQLLR